MEMNDQKRILEWLNSRLPGKRALLTLSSEEGPIPMVLARFQMVVSDVAIEEVDDDLLKLTIMGEMMESVDGIFANEMALPFATEDTLDAQALQNEIWVENEIGLRLHVALHSEWGH